MITEKKKSELVLRELRGKILPETLKILDFDSMVEVRAEFIRSKCSERKVSLSEEKRPTLQLRHAQKQERRHRIGFF